MRWAARVRARIQSPPPFRYLARKYPLYNLEEALGEGIVVGHEGLEMPQFQFDAKQVEALLAYLASIQKR